MPWSSHLLLSENQVPGHGLALIKRPRSAWLKEMVPSNMMIWPQHPTISQAFPPLWAHPCSSRAYTWEQSSTGPMDIHGLTQMTLPSPPHPRGGDKTVASQAVGSGAVDQNPYFTATVNSPPTLQSVCEGLGRITELLSAPHLPRPVWPFLPTSFTFPQIPHLQFSSWLIVK